MASAMMVTAAAMTSRLQVSQIRRKLAAIVEIEKLIVALAEVMVVASQQRTTTIASSSSRRSVDRIP